MLVGRPLTLELSHGSLLFRTTSRGFTVHEVRALSVHDFTLVFPPIAEAAGTLAVSQEGRILCHWVLAALERVVVRAAATSMTS